MVTVATKVASAGLSQCCPVDGWLHYCTTACCVTSSSTPPPQSKDVPVHFRMRKLKWFKRWQNKYTSLVRTLPFDKRRVLKKLKLRQMPTAVLYPEHPDTEARLKTGQQLFFFFFNLTESVRQNGTKESERREGRIACRKTQLQSMAQIEALPHRHPACYLKHISQAWKDSPCSPQDHWRWTSSRAADEMQVNQRK